MSETPKILIKELISDRLFLRAFLVLFVILLLLVVSGLFAFYRIESNKLTETFTAQQTFVLTNHQRFIKQQFLNSQKNLEQVSRVSKRYFLGEETKKSIEDTFYDLVLAQGDTVDQLRLLDVNGSEIIRINSNINGPIVVQQEYLQNKSDRYYVSESLSLAPGSTYYSKIDLNVENGSVEFPYKPVYRLTMPLYDFTNQLLGIVVVNINAKELLSGTASSNALSMSNMWVLNDESYWLYNQHHDLEWGFMFGQPDNRLAIKQPDLWDKFQHIEDDQIKTIEQESDIYFATKFSPTPLQSSLSTNNYSHDLYIIYVFDEVSLHALTQSLSRRYTSLAFFASLLVVAFSILLSLFYTYRNRINELIIRQQDLNKFDKQIRSALDISANPMLLVDRFQNIIYANFEAIALFEIPAADIGILNIDTLIPNEFKEAHSKLADKFLASPTTRKMAASREVSAITTNGRKLFVDITLSPIFSEQGNIVLVAVNDLSEKNLIESDLAKSNRTMTLAIETAQLGVWSWNVDDNAMLWDSRMLSLFGFPKNVSRKVSVQTWRDTIHQADIAKVDRVFEQSLSSLEPIQFDYRVYSSDGQLKWLKCGVVCESLSKVKRLVGVIQEITEEKVSHQSIATINKELERRVEQRSKDLKQAYHELESFSYAVSHDLRSPLRSIDGFSNLLTKSLGDQLNDKDRDFLNRIRLAAQRMGELIDDMLSLSRITRADIVFKRIDLVEVANSIMTSLRESDPGRQVSFICPEHLYANGDGALLRIALTNLLNNAWKFTHETEDATIELGIKQINDESVFFVQDNGAGFDMKHIDKLFVPFQRLHSNQTFQGNGIGLATVQRIIEKHGGKVWAEGVVDVGASFFFTLS